MITETATAPVIKPLENADGILFRCSSLGHIMTDARSKSELLSETCMTHLIDVFVSAKYSRREEITSKFIDKGNIREEDSITLLSRVKKTFYKKNTAQLSNEFIKGTPDLFTGLSIKDADETLDTKTSWSAHTFFRAQKKLDKIYEWQGRGYMALTGAKKHTVAYCLVNGTAESILSEKRKLQWALNVIDPEHDENYRDRCKQIEINHIFDMEAFIKEYPHFDFNSNINEWHYDIPMSERLFTFEFERNDIEIQRLYQRVKDCRTWMNENLFKKAA